MPLQQQWLQSLTVEIMTLKWILCKAFAMSLVLPWYRPFHLAGEKGNSLRIEPEEAKVVQLIFEMYGQQGMGYNAIAYKLNDLHIPARKGEWSQTSVVNILNNEVYLGKIRWRREPVKKVIKDGKITKSVYKIKIMICMKVGMMRLLHRRNGMQ